MHRCQRHNQSARVLEFLISITSWLNFDLYSKEWIPAAQRGAASPIHLGGVSGGLVYSLIVSLCVNQQLPDSKKGRLKGRKKTPTSGNFKTKRLLRGKVNCLWSWRTGVSGPIRVRCTGKRELQGWPKSLDSTYTHTPIVPTFPQLQIEVWPSTGR